jgi:hypothetical protein
MSAVDTYLAVDVAAQAREVVALGEKVATHEVAIQILAELVEQMAGVLFPGGGDG